MVKSNLLKRVLRYFFPRSEEKSIGLLKDSVKISQGKVSNSFSDKNIGTEYIPEKCQYQNCNEKLTIIRGKKCKYCSNYFCIYHLSPAEKHDCKEKLNTIPHAFREEFSKGRTIVHSK